MVANKGPTWLAPKLTNAIQDGMRMDVVDPRLSKTAEKADTWVPVDPGADGALAMGMARWIIAHDRPRPDLSAEPLADGRGSRQRADLERRDPSRPRRRGRTARRRRPPTWALSHRTPRRPTTTSSSTPSRATHGRPARSKLPYSTWM